MARKTTSDQAMRTELGDTIRLETMPNGSEGASVLRIKEKGSGFESSGVSGGVLLRTGDLKSLRNMLNRRIRREEKEKKQD